MLYDAAVIGLGAHGSSISAHLASRGVKVLGLEKYAPAHKNGSSHGRSRIFRTAYFEDPAYVPLLVRSLVLWKELNAREKAFQDDENSEELLKMTGALMIGAASDIEESESESLEVYLRSARGKSVLGGTYASIREHGLEHEILSAAEVKKRYGCFNLDDSEIALYEKDAGVLIPEMCIVAYLRMASDNGADLHYNESLASYTRDDDGYFTIISSTDSIYRAKKIVLSVGAWAPKLYGDVLVTPTCALPLYLERRVLFWFDTADNAAFETIPVYIWQTSTDGNFYGFPLQSSSSSGGTNPSGIKVAMHGMKPQPQLSSPGEVERSVSEEETIDMRSAVRERVPLLAEGSLSHTETCMYTCTQDWHFLLDWHPDHDSKVLLVSPCSGHGFKFSSVIGEICADLVIDGATTLDISLFKRKAAE